MKHFALMIAVLVFYALTACHDATPPPYHDGVPPQFDKPSDGGDDSQGDPDNEAELADEGLRYVGPELSLIYGEGGVLYVERKDRQYAFYDIDGNARVVLDAGVTAADGTALTGTKLTLNGRVLTVASARLLKSTAIRQWIAVVDSDGHSHIFVINP